MSKPGLFYHRLLGGVNSFQFLQYLFNSHYIYCKHKVSILPTISVGEHHV